MAISWYKNYLAADVQPWARQLQKEIDNLKSNFQSAEVNNVTRDDQLASSLRQVQNAQADAVAAQADADQAQSDAIAANTAAIAAQADATQAISDASAANTTAIAANSAAIAAQADATQAIGDAANAALDASTANTNALAALQDIIDLASPGGPTLNAANLTAGTITAVDIGAVNVTGATISGGSISSTGANGTVTVSNGSVGFSGGGKTGSINPTSTYGLGLTSSDRVYISAPNGIEGAFASFADIDALDINAQGTLRRSALDGGGTTGASITNGGYIVRTSSSQRYKQDIELLDIDLNDLYALQPKTFKRIDEVEEEGENARVYPGLIAEELAGTSLDRFVFYSKDENGNPQPEGIHYPELTAALLIAVQDLNARITTLEG